MEKIKKFTDRSFDNSDKTNYIDNDNDLKVNKIIEDLANKNKKIDGIKEIK